MVVLGECAVSYERGTPVIGLVPVLDTDTKVFLDVHKHLSRYVRMRSSK